MYIKQKRACHQYKYIFKKERLDRQLEDVLQRRAAAEAEAAEAELFAAQAKASLRAAREAEAVEQLFG